MNIDTVFNIFVNNDIVICENVNNKKEELLTLTDFVPPSFLFCTESIKMRNDYARENSFYQTLCEINHKYKVTQHYCDLVFGKYYRILFDMYIIYYFVDKYKKFKNCVNMNLLLEIIDFLEDYCSDENVKVISDKVFEFEEYVTDKIVNLYF